MVCEGTVRESMFVNGQFHDAALFSMLRQEFDRIHGGPDEWAEKTAAMPDKEAS
jgi:hypothetical protein